MKSFIVLLVIVAYVSCKYHNYDTFDLAAYLADPEKTKSFVACFKNEKDCKTQYDKEFRLDIKEMVATSCAACNQKEKENYQKAYQTIMSGTIKV
ncbi:hypothetical protein JYU34_014499 [Plutella xylostella]|uniref:Uncharacterized protein n=2 Tax=Plutella xylostella TaxID=51655 RepID=A0ABQ7Q9H8_PLUXY|nr:hypothetical protein JYU34_014499 [Plutella xylostella]CAG9123636.1 unnamed protein product [Plutella xylostella]